MIRLLSRRVKKASPKSSAELKPHSKTKVADKRGLFRRRATEAATPLEADAHHAFGPDLVDFATTYTLGPALVAMEEHSTGEAIRDVAAELISQHFGDGRRGLALCSASAGVGVGFVAANLALALADAGVSTLLVDANLRHPGLHEHVTPDVPVAGLREVLRSPGGDPHRVVQHQVVPHLSIVYAGGLAEDAQELLGGEWFRRVMQAYMRDYGVVLVATPPANRSADALRISAVVGHALIVVGRDLTFIDDVSVLTKQLEADGAAVIGMVMNRA